MPILSTFFGIIVRVFHSDHSPPHIHVEYSGSEAVVEIRTGKFLAGNLPLRAKKLFEEWRKIHTKDLEKAWGAAQANRMPERIEPLK